MIRVALDAMGGDHGAGVLVEGAAQASESSDCTIVRVGDKRELENHLESNPHNADRIEIVHSEGVIPMHAKPRPALAAQPHASLPTAAKLVADGGADALVSAGNTGAVILACADHFQRIRGVQRTALAAVVPTERTRGAKSDPFSLILDVGATVRVSAADLVGFGIMGSAYSGVISHNDRPRVALLSNGSESTKGTKEIVEAHAVLREVDGIEFIGNVEGVDIPKGVADVIVTDGFTGNVVLKMLEGVHDTVMDLARFAYRSKLSWRLALLLLRSGITQLKTLTDWQQYGGAPILGFDRLCIKAHGRSGSRAIRNAIKVATKAASSDFTGEIERRGGDRLRDAAE